MDLEDLYALHTDTSQLFGIEIYPYKMFKEFLPVRKETMEETGEIMNQPLKQWIKIMPHRDKEVEKFLLNDIYSADMIITYAGYVMKKRWPQGEQKIVEDDDPYAARRYAMMFDTRIESFEPIIMKHPEQAFYYAMDTIEGRWPEAEPYIKQNEHAWYEYMDMWGIKE